MPVFLLLAEADPSKVDLFFSDDSVIISFMITLATYSGECVISGLATDLVSSSSYSGCLSSSLFGATSPST